MSIARLLYATDANDAAFYRHASFVGSEDFIQRYPEHTKRVLKTLVLAAKWLIKISLAGSQPF